MRITGLGRTGAIAVIGIVSAALSGCGEVTRSVVVSSSPPHHIGSDVCTSCHQDEAARYARSHHALAMQRATTESVVATWAEEPADGVYRDSEGFWFVDGNERFAVSHTFGVYPLQQYLIEAGSGRKQALTLAWDDRAQADGGQRWFELYPPDSPGGAIHYSSRGMTWNAMCADCHSTGIVKAFADGAYKTTFVEETVGCEACHGPGSGHQQDPSVPLATSTDACMPCHSRRTQLREGYVPGLDVFDYYQPVAITPPLYHTDGQIDDEVYVWGSFQQSRMSAAGVTCIDCHDVHAAGMSSPTAATCVSCHSPNGNPRFPTLVPKSYALDDHFGGAGHEALDCIDCHMASKVYMGVDLRHDHSFRKPDPALATTLGSLDPCANCHADSVSAFERLVGRGAPGSSNSVITDNSSSFAVLASGHLDQYSALPAIIDIATASGVPLLQRTQAIRLLANFESPRGLDVARRALADSHPLVRIAGVWSLDRLAPAPRWGAIKRLLADPVRAVRFAVINHAVAYLGEPIEARETDLIESVLDDYETTLRADADHPESHVAEASILQALGRTEEALAALDRALAIEPRWVSALINQSIIFEASGNADAAAATLLDATAIEPKNAAAFYARGLFLIRAGHRDDAALALNEAHAIEPSNRQFGYAAALARASLGDIDGAIERLAQLAMRFGPHAPILTALATHLRDAGRTEEALEVAQRLVEEHGASFTPLLRDLGGHLALP